VNPQIIIAAIIAAASFGTAWRIQDWRFDAKEKTHAEQKLVQVQQSAAADIRRLDNTITAQNRSTNRAVALRRDLDSARSELERLRIAIAHGVPGTSAAADACPESGSERDNVLLECIASYETLARDADLWKNDALMLRDAWPTR
jgi:type II secretory pathway pseudopilin PulG